MAFKWLGNPLALSAAGGFGVWSAMQRWEQLCLLEKLQQIIYSLKDEITYSHTPLAEGLECMGKRDPGSLRTLSTSVAERTCRQEGESLQEIWSREVGPLSSPKVRLSPTDEDLEQLAGLEEHLGYLDVDMQERTLKLYLEQLDLSTGYLRTNQREKCRLYISFGIMGGMFLVIMIY